MTVVQLEICRLRDQALGGRSVPLRNRRHPAGDPERSFDLILRRCRQLHRCRRRPRVQHRNVLISVGVFFAAVAFSSLALPRVHAEPIAVSMFASFGVLGARRCMLASNWRSSKFSWSDWQTRHGKRDVSGDLPLVRWLSGFSAGWAAFLGTEALIVRIYIWSLRRVRWLAWIFAASCLAADLVNVQQLVSAAGIELRVA